jgi:transglutaminase-like putative cysteine protease
VRRLQIDHQTEYSFAGSTLLMPHRLMLRPRENHAQRITSFMLTISPANYIRWQRDTFDNSVAIANFTQPSLSLWIASRVLMEHFDDQPFDFLVEDHAAMWPFSYLGNDQADLAPLQQMSWPNDRPTVEAWLRSRFAISGRVETFWLLDQLNRTIANSFRYQMREEAGVQSPARTLTIGSGSCRDLAALFIESCRYLGLASRFVSGYHTSYANELGGGSTHAWAEVYLPGPGWKGFDPTAGLLTGPDHIPVSVARHPETVPPVSGSYLGPSSPQPTMRVSVRVAAI